MKNTDQGSGTDDEILLLKANPAGYLDAESFWETYAPTELIRKFQGLRLTIDPKAKAIESFGDSENQCAKTNRRLRLHQDPSGRFELLLERMRKNLEEMLGDVSPSVLNRCIEHGGWGKGVTSSCKGKWLSEYHKLAAQPQATRTFLELGSAYWRDLFPADLREIEVVAGSTLGFVPKTSATHRSICVEPSVNAFLQKGIGNVLRIKMKRRWGLDLSDQTRNQKLAREGSLDNSFATIDLSSASDTVSFALVERLMPKDWFSLLKAPRCAFTKDEHGLKIFLNKWSSMGNGYTFELETAIFAAAVKSVISHRDWVSGRWAVYGDDIIVRSHKAEELCQLLGYLGFSTNDKKTFLNGPFRESCGADFFEGRNVRPFYLKRVDWLQAVELTNWLRAESSTWMPESRWKQAHQALVKEFDGLVPFVPAGPHGLVGLWQNPDEFEKELAVKWNPLDGQFELSFVGYSWAGLTVESREALYGIPAMYAHLRRQRTQTDSASCVFGEDDDALPTPWMLSATKVGRWERKRSGLASDSVYWLP